MYKNYKVNGNENGRKNKLTPVGDEPTFCAIRVRCNTRAVPLIYGDSCSHVHILGYLGVLLRSCVDPAEPVAHEKRDDQGHGKRVNDLVKDSFKCGDSWQPVGHRQTGLGDLRSDIPSNDLVVPFSPAIASPAGIVCPRCVSPFPFRAQ